MKKSRFTIEQMIESLRRAGVGMAAAELARQYGFNPASFYQWQAKYGGMEAEDTKRLRACSRMVILPSSLADAKCEAELPVRAFVLP